MPVKMKKVYLGDGVYAEYDGYHIVLTTEDGVKVTNTIYLDLAVWDKLYLFRANIEEE